MKVRRQILSVLHDEGKLNAYLSAENKVIEVAEAINNGQIPVAPPLSNIEVDEAVALGRYLDLSMVDGIVPEEGGT